jgi:hypothetical protein
MRESSVDAASYRRNGRQIDRRQGDSVRVVSLSFPDDGEDRVRRVVVALGCSQVVDQRPRERVGEQDDEPSSRRLGLGESAESSLSLREVPARSAEGRVDRKCPDRERF